MKSLKNKKNAGNAHVNLATADARCVMSWVLEVHGCTVYGV